jgi:thioredoxin-like negative regulator of GroEL
MAKIAVETRAGVAGPRPWSRAWAIRFLLLAAVAAAVIGGVAKLWEHRRYRRAMLEIKQEIRAGRHGHAVRKLATLLEWKPDSDEATYLLGVCEKARGQAPAAFRAWERVSPGSPFGAQAIQGRMELLIERGRLADAETLIDRAMSDPRADGSRLGLFLGLVYSLQGRVEDRQRVIEACWDRLNAAGEGATERAILLIRLHIQTSPIEEVRTFLDRAAQSASNDDRVWLGKAHLAIRDGSYDEAARWIEACLRRRPDDVPVWRARLEWAMATRRLDDVRQAMGHLPDTESTPAQVQRLTAWFAASRGDLDAERQALERLIAVEPADLAALDRLAAIAEKDGQPDRAAGYRGRKAEIGQLQARYEKLYRRNQTLRDAAEMAGLAEQLGRPFEAKVFRTIAAAHPLKD